MSSTPESTAPGPSRRNWLKGLSALLTGGLLLGRNRAAAAPTDIYSTNGANPVYLGEIMMVAFNFAPRGFALCNGQLLPINQNQALFALLGTMYGGNGQTNFALPDLNGRVPIGAGQGPGLTDRVLGETGGAATVTLQSSEIPIHTHSVELTYSTALGTTGSPANAFLASNASGLPQYAATGTSFMGSGDIGTPQAHNNLQPYLALAFYIALRGVFPPR